ncbi:zinc ribbon domain-containing protein [Lacticaseibacillus paracasei]|uniref:zinc ribbon domain-containing protein n=1 Tax=Lacticaseibacillus paracasei TaxID=1597 RepID=UPI00156D58A5|nr:zinc ribbon domain-containing protein [Lacticaseibacillus paracasei]QKK93934.1 zinc ribbon domain-containing protein [Lacticaseibacillus paracasei]
MFKICPNCGAHNTATAKFCTRCGTSLAGVVATAETAVQSAQPTSENEASTANTAAVSEQSSVPSSLTSSSAQNQPVTPQQAQSQVTPPDNSQQPQNQVPPQPAGTQTQSQQAAQGPAPTAQPYQQADQTQQQAQTPPEEPNPTVEATKKYAGSYWRYLVDSIKHPATVTRPYHQYFGLTSLAITIVSLALTIALMTGSAVSSLPGAIASNVLMTFLKLVFLVAVLMIAVVAVYYLVVNGMLGDRRRSFLTFTTEYAFHCNWMVFFSVFTLLMQMLGMINIGSIFLIWLLLSLGSGLFVISGTYMLFTAQSTNRFDKIYAYLIVGILLVIVFLIIMTFGLSSILGGIGQGINDFGRSFNF